MTNFTNFSLEYLCQVIDILDATTDDYLFVFDYQQDFFYIAPHAVKRFALEENAVYHATKSLAKLVYPEDLGVLHADMDEIVTSGRIQNITYRWMSKDNEPVWINSRGYTLRDAKNDALYLVGCINEIGRTEHKADNLSGLLGIGSLEAYLSQYEEQFPEGYILLIGLDDLKGINARFGLEYGDVVLRKTAEFIAESIVPGQQIFRILGDEFVVVDFLGNGEDHARALFGRLQQAIDTYTIENNYQVVFSVSAGFLSTKDAVPASYAKVMSLTEFTLGEAKKHGKNQCYSYSEEEYQTFLKRKRIIYQLRQAINNDFDGFEVYYQPLFDPFTYKLAGAEALMRFRSEDYGMISPGEFIPLLEETSLIVPAGRWILHQALKLCKEIKQKIPSFHISINLSYVQVLRKNIEDEIISAIYEHQLSPSDVMIELTESGMLESNERFASFWKKLKSEGVSLALDDFGSGYSNFRYLAELGPDMVKIDRNFTAGAIRSNYEYELLSLFSKMVHQLNLKVCVEGVETEHEFAKICELPPEYIQGYYLGRPCPTEQFIAQYVNRSIS